MSGGGHPRRYPVSLAETSQKPDQQNDDTPDHTHTYTQHTHTKKKKITSALFVCGASAYEEWEEANWNVKRNHLRIEDTTAHVQRESVQFVLRRLILHLSSLQRNSKMGSMWLSSTPQDLISHHSCTTCTYHLQNFDFRRRLIVVGGLVLDDLDGHLLASARLALDHLAKGALAQHVDDAISTKEHRQRAAHRFNTSR